MTQISRKRVVVRDADGSEVELIVLREEPNLVIGCRAERFDAISKGKRPEPMSGFPASDVIREVPYGG